MNDKVWKTKNGDKIPMMEMSEEHMQKAFVHINSKLLHYHISSSKLDELREEMEEVAKERNIVLKYPDEVFPSKKWGSFFSNVRKTRDMPYEKGTPAVVVTHTENNTVTVLEATEVKL